MEIAMIDDKIVRFDHLEPPYLDRGIFFGDGVYEVLRSYNGRIFALQQHLERFSSSLDAVRITSVDIGHIRHNILRAFDQARIPNAKIYFHVTRGSAPRSHEWDENLQPNFFLAVTELADDAQIKQTGIAVSTHPDWRWKKCHIKSLNLLPNVLARQDAAAKGAAEAILVDDNGLITEGAGSAFFAVFGRSLQTAPLTANILPSITREFVLKAATMTNMQVVEKSLTPAQAADAHELFIAVTTKDIVPVVKFDNKIIGDGTVGKYTKQLIEQFQAFTL